MKPFPKLPNFANVGWLIALSTGLWLLYLLFNRLGFSTNDSKGLSLLALLVIIAVGLIANRQWFVARWDHRFKGLSLEQKILELDRVFEEQVAAGNITRAELNEMRMHAKAKFEREGFGERDEDKSV